MALVVAAALTAAFWWPLWQGGGLIGGDLYPYYFPQKQFLTQSLHEGQVPLWNNLVGLGYPVLGESQTGALYPPNLLLYRLFDMNTAYNVSQLAHYVLAFLGAWGLGRQLGLRNGGALLSALAYVYGWFPARICLEWAIIGGAYLVWILWCVVRYRVVQRHWLLGAIALLLGADLLAGHYNLAFITLLVAAVLTIVPKRFLAARLSQEGTSAVDDAAKSQAANGRLGAIWLSLAIIGGFLVAAVQVIPSFELKSLSQRAAAGEAFSPGYGHLPPLAITQLLAPWMWHSAEIDTDQALQAASPGTIPASTNKAEAFVYAGLIPLLLTIYGWINFAALSQNERRQLALWTCLALAALFFATGWPIVWLQWAPGFSYFTGPGRYTIVTTLALGIMSGMVLDWLLEHSRPALRVIAIAVVLVLTSADLWAVSREYQFGPSPYFGRQVFYATLVDTPPIEFVGQSTVRKVLSNWPEPEAPEPARLYAPGPNVATLTAVSAIPVYLGIGPKVYADQEMRFDFWGTPESPPDREAITVKLRQWGVTHLLLEQPLDETRWPVGLVFRGTDPFLNRAFGRLGPYYLYELNNPPQRAYFADTSAGSVQKVTSEPNRVLIDVIANAASRLTLRELMYPGWEATVDGKPSQPVATEDFRTVELQPGRHHVVWSYHPKSVTVGAVFSGLGILIALALIARPGRRSERNTRSFRAE